MRTNIDSGTGVHFRPFLFLLILLVHSSNTSQAQHQLDIGLFQGSTSDVLELRVRSAETFQFIVSEITFTIRWETASGASLGAMALTPCASVSIPLVASGDGQIDQNGSRYQTYSGFGTQQLQSCSFESGYSWPAGQEIVIATIPVLNMVECVNFAIVNDSYTLANNKNYYSSFGGMPVTGVIYTNEVQICNSQDLLLTSKAMLDGPFNSGAGLMSDNLRNLGIIPTAQPYSGAPWNYAGTETADASIFAVTGNDAIVDWVLLELRDENTPSTILARRAAFVQRDGSIVDLDGVSPVLFTGTPAGDYYLAVRHRNHLGAMTASPYALSHIPTDIDLTDPATATYGTGARRVRGSVMTLWGGDANSNGVINYAGSSNDRQAILTFVGAGSFLNPVAGYHSQDVNMNGQVTYAGSGNDRQAVLSIIGASSFLNPIIQQLP